MRIALLAAQRTTPGGALRSHLMLAARSVLDWQIALARDLGCERIVVLGNTHDIATSADGRADLLQGAELHMLKNFTRLPAMLHSQDELLVMCDGLIGDPDLIKALLSRHTHHGTAKHDTALRKVVVCLPSDAPQAQAFPEDFERVDAGRCWAGVLLMQATSAQQLAEFPPDSNPVSLLLRLALQAGVPCHCLSPDESTAHRWLLAHDEVAVSDRERAMIGQSRAEVFWSAPLAAVAEQIIHQTGSRGLRRGEPISTLGGVAALLTGMLLAAFDFVPAAVILCAAATFAFALAHRFAKLDQRILRTRPNRLLFRLREPGGDVAISVIGMMALAGPAGMGPLSALAPLAVGTTRLAAAWAQPAASAFWQDRTGQLVLLAVAAGSGVFPQAMAAWALGALAQALLGLHRAHIPE